MGSMARKSTRSAKESKGVAASKSKKRRSNSNANSVAASISTTTIGSSCESSSSASRSTFLEVMRRQRNSFKTFFVIYSTSDEPVPDHVMEHFSQETIFHVQQLSRACRGAAQQIELRIGDGEHWQHVC